MADMANIVVYDDSTTPVQYTFIPKESTPDPVWIESSSTKSQIAKAKQTMSRVVQKNGLTRRLHKLELPIMEQASGGDLTGNVAPPKVAHTVVLQISGFIHERATDAEVANATKMLVNSFLGDTAAGTGDAYKNATGQAQAFMIHDIIAG